MLASPLLPSLSKKDRVNVQTKLVRLLTCHHVVGRPSPPQGPGALAAEMLRVFEDEMQCPAYDSIRLFGCLSNSLAGK